MIKSLPFSVFYCESVENTYSFWKSLDFNILNKEEDKIVVGFSDFEIHYILDSTEPFKEYQFATRKEGRGNGVLIYFEIGQIEEFKNKVGKLKTEVITDIKENHWGGREFMFSDPDGFLFVAYSMN